jgi:hypothetical protein
MIPPVEEDDVLEGAKPNFLATAFDIRGPWFGIKGCSFTGIPESAWAAAAVIFKPVQAALSVLVLSG